MSCISAGSWNSGLSDSRCSKCAKKQIRFTVLLQGITNEQINAKSSESFKQLLINLVQKSHPKGLKSIRIHTLSTYKQKNLLVEFICSVNPKYNEKIHSAIRQILVSTNVNSIHFKFISFLIRFILF